MQGLYVQMLAVLGSLLIALSLPRALGQVTSQVPTSASSASGAAAQTFDSLRRATETPEQVWAALNAAYPPLFEAGSLTAKDHWVSEYFSFLNLGIRPESQMDFFRLTGFYAFLLYPDLGYSETTTKLTDLAGRQGLVITPEFFRSMDQVSSPEGCAEKTLLTAEAILGPLRKTEQRDFKTCFVHAGVRAADYLNASTGNIQPRTSILSAILAMSAETGGAVKRPNALSLQTGGYQEYTVSYLMAMGGCAETEWDRLAGAESEEKLKELELSIRELGSSANILADGSDSEATEVMRSWSPATKKIVAEAAAAELKKMSVAATSGNATALSEAAGRLRQMARVFASAGVQLYEQNFNGFADFVYRESFCQAERVRYSPAEFEYLLIGKNGESTMTEDEVQQIIDQQFKRTNPQPLMTSFYADVTADMNSTERKLPHSALIVGQRYDQKLKQCSYQILDSNAAAHIDPRLQPEEATNSYWLPLHLLKRAVFLMSTLKLP